MRKIEYDARDFKLKITDNNGIEYTSKEEILEAYDYILHSGNDIPSLSKDELDDAIKQTQNLMFSAPKSVSIAEEQLIESTRKSLQNKYPNNAFLLAYHSDSDNPHVHVILKISDENGRRIDLRKQDLRDLRTSFCEELKTLGYEVTATYKHGLKREYAVKNDREVNQYTVLNFGEAPYQNIAKNNQSFYLKYATKKGEEVTLWGKELAEQVAKNNVDIGDKVTIKKGEKQKILVPMYDNSGTISHYKEAEKNSWAIENLNSKKLRIAPENKPVIHDDFAKKQAIQLQHKMQFEHVKAQFLHDSGRQIAIEKSPILTHNHEVELTKNLVQTRKNDLHALPVEYGKIAERHSMPEGLDFKERLAWKRDNEHLALAQQRGIPLEKLAERQVMPEGLDFKERLAWKRDNEHLALTQQRSIPLEKLAERQVMPEGLSGSERFAWKKENQLLAKSQQLGIPIEQLAEKQIMPEGLALRDRLAWTEQRSRLEKTQSQALKMKLGFKFKMDG